MFKNKELIFGFVILLSLSLLSPLYANKANHFFKQKPKSFYDELVLHFIEYDALDIRGNPLALVRIGRENDGGYVVPVQALNQAEALLGYGIGDDISFEEAFCDLTQKPAYAFDGGVSNIAISNYLCSFFSECIGNDKFLWGNQYSSGKSSTFSEQITRLGLEESPVFIKMDIEGAEYDCFMDILLKTQQITGFVIEIHFLTNPHYQNKAKLLLEAIEKDFVLIHLHANNFAKDSLFSSQYVKGLIPHVVELSYINKNLLGSYRISRDQKHPKSIDMNNNPNEPDCEFKIKSRACIDKLNAS